MKCLFLGLILVLIGGCDGEVPMVQRDGESVERNVPSVGPLSERVQVADATPTPTPSPVATPVLPDVPEPTAPAEADEPVLEPIREAVVSSGDAQPAPIPGTMAIQGIVCQHAYSWDCASAIRVFTCESGLRADAISYNGSSFGVAQIWSGHAGRFPGFWERWMIPKVNIGWAYELWLDSGWAPWRESRLCWWVP